MSRKKNQKVVKMKRRNSHVLGIFLCIFSIYLIILFVQSFTNEHVSIYEVNKKQIADNENLRGLVLRDEEVVTSVQAGYVNYYVGEGSRLAANTTVYSIDKNGSVADQAATVDTADVTLSEQDTEDIRNDIANFRDNFSLSDYSGILNFRYNVENTLLELTDINLAKNLNKVKKEAGNGTDFSLVKASASGIISFCSDGMEDTKLDSLKPEQFQEMTDHWKQLRTGKSIKAGAPVYRLVKSEKWSIVVQLSREQYSKLVQKKQVLVKIKKDNSTLSPTVRTFSSNGKYYANLIFDKYMIHYLNNRYLDVEIQFNNAEGLKIPTSSIITKKFYVVPKDCITKGDGQTVSGKDGIVTVTYDSSGKEEISFLACDIYWKDEKGNSYIDANLVPAGTMIKNSSGEKLQLTNIKKLDGVYNCNQGYCKFQYIHKLYENKEYAIVEEGNTYSLSNYDHIILNPDIITEDDIIY